MKWELKPMWETPSPWYIVVEGARVVLVSVGKRDGERIIAAVNATDRTSDDR